MIKVTTESITEAAASLNTQAARLDEISEQLSRIERQIRQASTQFERQIQSIEQQRKAVEQQRLTLSRLAKAASSAAELYEKCEQEAMTGSSDTETGTETGTGNGSVQIPLILPKPGTGYIPFIPITIRPIRPRQIWPIRPWFYLPLIRLFDKPGKSVASICEQTLVADATPKISTPVLDSAVQNVILQLLK